MLEINQLRCFVAVAEELHFSRAAERLHMTQPPLSRQIQLLEHIIGLPLFIRSNRMVKLTPAGRNLLPEARTILRLAAQARQAALRTGQGEAGRLVLGFTTGAACQFLPQMLIRLRKALPGIELQLQELGTARQLEALAQGQIDLGLLRPVAGGAAIQTRRVAAEGLLAALPAAHALAQRPVLRLQDLHAQPLVMYSPTEAPYLHDLVREVCAAQQVQPRYEQQVGQVSTALALVQAGLGLALVPESASQGGQAGMVYRPVEGISPAAPVALHVGWCAANDNPVLSKVLALLECPHEAQPAAAATVLPVLAGAEG